MTATVENGRAVSEMTDEEYTIVDTATHKHLKKIALVDEDEPLIDTTATLELHSKKTKRLEKLKAKKQRKINVEAVTKSFLELPAELLAQILGYLRPSDMRNILLINRATRDFVQQHESSIARDMLRRRYWVLSRCFPLPVLMNELDEDARAALLNPRREKTLEVHMKPYQHIRNMDTRQLCSCHSCLFAWNNLCIVLDLASFQGPLDRREPIPMIARGTNPEWNIVLTQANARIVEDALHSPMLYARILEKHLDSIVGTLLRSSRYARKVPNAPRHRHSRNGVQGRGPVYIKPAYQLTEEDAGDGTDEFLERQGDNSYQMPFHRDNYYNQSMMAYVPNRKWSKEEQRWIYYAAGNHDRDLALAVKWFGVRPSHAPDQQAFIASFQAAMSQSLPTPPPATNIHEPR